MWFGFELRASCPRWQTRLGLASVALAVAVAVAATIASHAPLSRSGSPAGSPAPCVRISGHAALYCGPASARLSPFPGTLFRGGFCARKTVAGVRLLQVRIGAKALDESRANDGLPYFSLGSAVARSQPTSGNVIAFFRSRRWLGRVVSMQGDAGGGIFVADGVAGRGRASGQFRCD
jgi:hypothetical protein